MGHASPLYYTINSAGELTLPVSDSAFVLNNMDWVGDARKSMLR